MIGGVRRFRGSGRAIAIAFVALASTLSMITPVSPPARAAGVTPTLVLGWTPGVGQGLSPRTPLTVYFNRPMDRTSVQLAWRITPAIAGSLTGSEGAFTFRPSSALQPGRTYHLTIGTGALATDGVPLARPFGTSFRVGDALRVSAYTPQNGTRAVPPTGLISVTFNHPMVPLAGLEVPPGDPAGWRVTIFPHLPGYGSWLGTSTWEFHPTSGLAPSTRYTVTLSGATQDSSGDQLGGIQRWSFNTITPEVFSRTPRSGARFVDPRSVVTVTFNQPMKDRSAGRAFSLRTAGGGGVRGRITWRGDTLTFHPSSLLAGSNRYYVSVQSWARSANSAAILGKTAHWSFRVAPAPQLVGTNPAQNGTAYSNGYYGNFPPGSYHADLSFNTPMNQASLDRHLTVSPTISHLATSFYGPDQTGEWQYDIEGDFNPSATYTISLGPGVVDRFGRSLGSATVLHFTTARLVPSVALYGNPGTSSGISVSAGTAIHIPIQVINVPRVHYTLVRTTLAALGSNCCSVALARPGGAIVRSWSVSEPHPLNKIEDLRITVTQKDGTPLRPGLYWLGAVAPSNLPGAPPAAMYPPESGEVVAVTDTNLTVKFGGNETLVWANSAKTGKPAANLRIKVLNYQGTAVQSGTTGSDGIHIFPRTQNQGQLSTITYTKGHFGLAESGWSPNLPGQFGPFPFANVASFPSGPYFGSPCFGCRSYYGSGGTYLYTDRPIYRPGQQVHFRGVLWKDSDGVYSRFGPHVAILQANGNDGRSLYRARVKVDRFGSVHGSFLLPAHAQTGQGFISIAIPRLAQAQTSFTIAEYRKPEFLASVSTQHSEFIRGQSLVATAHVQYVFGAPVNHQRVSWVAYGQPRIPQPLGWDSYSFFDWEDFWNQSSGANSGAQSQFGQILAQGKGTTNSQGRLTFKVPLDLARKTYDQDVTIEVTASDVNHQTVSARTELPAYHSDLAIGLDAPSQVVAAGKPATVAVAATRQDGAALPGNVLSVQIYKRTYTNKLVKVGVQQTAWQAVPHDTPVQSLSLTSDAQGKSTITFTPATGGEYRLVVAGKDALGNSTSTAISIDASTAGSTDWGLSTNTSLTLKPDKSTYSVGDTAHILVQAPFDDASALVTVERGNIRKYWVEHLSTNSSTVDVPVTIDDLPNVYVSVTVYRGWRGTSPPDWRYGSIDLQVRTDPRHLIVHLVQNGFRHHPRDPVTYRVTTTDTQGHPVSAEISLALVDTAVLALQDETNADILQAFYAQQPLGVSTQSDGAVSIDHLQGNPDFPLGGYGPMFGLNGVAKGSAQRAAPAVPSTAGGGGGPPSGAQTITVRSNFADTAYWSAAVITNQAGHATVRLKLPDNATTWRLDARGLTTSQSVGQATLRTLATQDLVLRPVLPRFLVEGDRLTIGAVLNNTLARPVRARISVAARGLAVQGSAFTVSVPAHGERMVSWPSTVPVAKSAQITMYAVSLTGGVRGDAVLTSLPVSAPLTDETVASAGQVYGSSRELVVLPANAVSVPGALTIHVSASLTAGLGAAFGEFRAAANEGNDTVAYRLLSAAALHSLPASITGLSVGESTHLPGVIDAAVQKLLTDQDGDGGWPWFNGPVAYSDPFVTAETVRALAASGSHRPIVRQAINRGRVFIHNNLVDQYTVDGQLPNPERAALMLALAQTGGAPRSLAEDLYNNSVARSHLDNGSLADLGLTLALAHDGRHARSIAATLDGNAMVSATGAHWEGDYQDIWSAPAIGTTTQVLDALLTIEPHDAFVPAAARWLMLARRGTDWDCLSDSADAIVTLARYARAAREGHANYQYRVSVDGISHLTGSYGGNRQAASASTKVPVARLHRGSASSVDIGRGDPDGSFGSGPLYYVTQLKYYLPANDIAARSEGLSVSRQFISLKGKPISRIAAGSAYRVALTLHTNQSLLYLDIEDPLPVGAEAIDGSLNTSQQGLFKPPVWFWAPSSGPQDLTPFLIHTDLRDNRVSLYSYFLPPGTYHYSYLAQATVPGQYGVPPTHASESYFPEVFGRSAGQMFTVTG